MKHRDANHFSGRTDCFKNQYLKSQFLLVFMQRSDVNAQVAI